MFENYTNLDWITLALALGTCIMAFYTRKSAAEMSKTRKETNAANIIIYFKQKGHKLNLIIKNVGKTTAKNVEIKSEPSIENSQGIIFDRFIEKITTFPPEFEIVSFFDMTPDYLEKFPDGTKHQVSITFNNIYGETIVEEYILDLSYVKGVMFLGNEADDIETTLFNIKEILKKSKNQNFNEFLKNF